jgi:TupA-like ATPgrasp
MFVQLMHALPAKWHVMLDYLRAHGRLPDLKNPRTFNEKMAWRKLYERDPRFPDLLDKIKAKQFIGNTYGKDLIIPTLAIYDRPAEMDFTQPPLCVPPYVIKCNHGCGMNIFVKDSSFAVAAIQEKLDTWLNTDHSEATEEWAYSRISPRILVEPYLGNLTDYKFHVFSGVVYAIEVVLDRFGKYTINIYDRNWQLLGIKRYANRLQSDKPVQPPQTLGKMLKLAEAIGKEFSYVRVDLYEINKKVVFGEFTIYAGAAFDRFEPVEWDWKFGEQWQHRPVDRALLSIPSSSIQAHSTSARPAFVTKAGPRSKRDRQ